MIPWKRTGEWLELSLPYPLGMEEQLQSYMAISSAYIKKLHKSGGIAVKGNRVSLKLFPNEPLQDMPDWVDIDVLYEDDFCLVVHKPAGMRVHGDGSQQRAEKPDLYGAVACYYAGTGQQCKVRHIHRLDEDTTGPVLYAKHEWAQSILDEAMRNKGIGRAYVAIVHGQIATDRGTIDAPIGRDRHHSSRRRVSATGDNAITHYEVIERFEQASLVKLQLETGRTHQIRVHLSYLGYPIWGDKLYGGTTAGISRQMLHGEHLAWKHPLTGEFIEVFAPWPSDFQKLRDSLQKI